MKKTFTFLFLFLIVSISHSQIKLNLKASVNNELRYGSGYEYISTHKTSKEYFENLTNARLDVNDVIFGIRFEVSDPIEYGRDFKGIRKRYIEYKHKSGISLRAGDFFDIVSRGLSLNVFEDRGLAYDTGIDGVRIIYKNNFGKKKPVKVKAQIIGGNLEYSDFLNPERIENYKIRSANLEISPIKRLTFGTNYVNSKGEIPTGGVTTNITADIPEFYVDLNLSNFQFYSSYAHKHINTEPNTIFPVEISADGDGLYSSLSYTYEGLGVTLEYKNYRFDLTEPNNRSTDRPTKMLPFQNPPTAIKEHTSTLISRNPHVVDFNDEVGGQIDIFYVVSDKLSFNLNGAIASRHYEYNDADTTSKIVYKRVDKDNSFIPSLDDAFSPFWEVYFETEYYATEDFYTKFAFARQNGILYNQIFPLASEKLFTTTIPTEFRYSLNKEFTLKLIFEQQWVHNSIRIDQKSFMNQFVSLSLSKSPDLSVTFNSEFSNDEEEPTGKKSWFLGEVLYKINQSNSVIVSYGSERGGLRCTNGICRFVNPFEGFRATVQTLF